MYNIAPHQFTVDGKTYEWMGTRYFLKINELSAGQSFGETALLKRKPRNATIKTNGEGAHFMVLSKANYDISVSKIE